MVLSRAKSLSDNGYLVTCFRLPQGFDGARILGIEKIIASWRRRFLFFFLIYSSDFVSRKRALNLVRKMMLSR